MSDNVRVHIFVSGIVQGVFFRADTKATVQKLGGVAGWVRNTEDGRVEAIFEGEKEKVEGMVAWARKGPPGARVEKVDVVWENYTGEFKNFEIYPVK